MDKIRGLIFDKQCSLCGYDIEMCSYVVQEDRKNYETLSHLSCYMDNISKDALKLNIEECKKRN